MPGMCGWILFESANWIQTVSALRCWLLCRYHLISRSASVLMRCIVVLLITGSSGQQSCTSCPAASYTSVGAQSACALCALGHHQSLSGQTFCTSCPPGYFSDNTGRQDCLPCSNGQFASGNASIQCSNCARGKSQVT